MGNMHEDHAAAGPETTREPRAGAAANEVSGGSFGPPAVLALQRAAGNQAVTALLARAARLQRQPQGPAAKIPADRGDLERGFFSVTKKATYGVRAAGPKKPEGLWFDHLFETQAAAEAYAKSLAAKGEQTIREAGALPRAWPAKAPAGAPVPGNPVVNVYVIEIPAGTSTISGAVRSQPESSTAPGLPASYPGGGPQTVIAEGTTTKVVGVFRVQGAITPPSHQLPAAPAVTASTGAGSMAFALAEAESLTPVTIRAVLREAIASGVLQQIARNLVKSLIVGVLLGLVTAWAHYGILKQRLKLLEPVIRDRLLEALPAGIEKGLRHPTKTVYACVVIRITHPSGISLDLRSRGEGPPDAPAKHVRVFFDLEPHEGEIAHGLSGNWLLFDTWTAYGKSVRLDELLEQVSPALRERFNADRNRAREAFYAEHPSSRPASSVSSTPREDPLAGRR
jgi:hypothetical protein